MNKSSGKLWPYGIILAFILFILFFVYIVTKIYKSDYSLVSSNPYEQGIKHDQLKKAIQRTDQIGIKIEYFGGNQKLKISFPKGIKKEGISGFVHYFRPSTAKLDFTVPLKLNETNVQLFNLKKLEKGFWTIKLDFTMEEKQYHQEYSFSK